MTTNLNPAAGGSYIRDSDGTLRLDVPADTAADMAAEDTTEAATEAPSAKVPVKQSNTSVTSKKE